MFAVFRRLQWKLTLSYAVVTALLALMFAFARAIHESVRDQRSRTWNRRRAVFSLFHPDPFFPFVRIIRAFRLVTVFEHGHPGPHRFVCHIRFRIREWVICRVCAPQRIRPG